MDEQEFEVKYTKLICEALKHSKGSYAYHAAIIETVARSLGRSIAMFCHGDAKATNDFLEGAIHYAENEAARYQELGKFFGKMGSA